MQVDASLNRIFVDEDGVALSQQLNLCDDSILQINSGIAVRVGDNIGSLLLVVLSLNSQMEMNERRQSKRVRSWCV